MRVLFVTREYPPFEVGGVGRHTYYLVKNLKKLGVYCKVISFGNSKYSSDDVVFLNPSSSIIDRSSSLLTSDVKIPSDIVRFSGTVNNLISREHFDLVHVEEPYVGSFVKHNTKITTFHDTSYGEFKSMLHYRGGAFEYKRALFYASLGPFLELMSAISSKAIVVPFSHVKTELVRIYQIPSNRIRVILNGVQIPEPCGPAEKTEAKQKLGIPSDRLLIFSAGRHVIRKRLDLLVKAVRSLYGTTKNSFRVVIAGDGPYRSHVARLVKKYDLDRVIDLPGWISEEKLSLYYQASDIFVLASEYETGPICLLEAMSFGAVAVTSNINGFPSMIRDGVDGLLFPVGDHLSLARCLDRLLNDSTLRNRMSVSSKVFARNFDWKLVAEATKNLYRSLL